MRRSLSPTDLAQKAFVRGFAEEVDEEAVRRLFSKYGTVTDVHIAKDRETQRPRGFGFVTFSSSTDCNKACEGLEGKEFHGKILQVELASHYKKPGSRGGFGGRGRGSFRGGRGGGSPPRDSYRRGGSSFRGSWRGGRDDFKGGYGGSRVSEERYRGSYERDLPPRDYGGRFESSLEYRGARAERSYLDGRGDYPSYRGGRDYPPGGSDRDYLPPRSGRDLGGYYSPPRSSRDYPPAGGRDFPPAGRDYPTSRSDRDFDIPPRRYAARDYDEFPISSSDAYDIRGPPRRDCDSRGPPPREFSGTTGRYESFSGNGRASYKSPRGASYRDSEYGGGRGSISTGRRAPPRDEERIGSTAGMRRPQRAMDGPPTKKMKSDEAVRRSPRGGGAPSRRY